MRCKLFRRLLGCFDYWCNVLKSMVVVSHDSSKFLTRVSRFLFLLGLNLGGGDMQASEGLCFSAADHCIQFV